ncbi:DUF3182 family protein [Pseudoxanthomonas suwonensis]|uniref:Biotin carboxylase n=1 Tax=Pseudoxanthomonas suwonensis TaxID=314722 RepID=A0A0E3UP13_9GAMM|nr:DUF3182 family protein [Pseudoxanthomonas suwonensis]AKC87651.1 biotin carboxylase [Pseudoxanthomonas suwonensis]
MPPLPPPSATPRTVLTLCAGGAPRDPHERATQVWIAQRLAALTGWEFGGEYDPQRLLGAASPYFVPDATLTTAQAARLGIEGEHDLFGGVVPHAFVADKVITHPLPAADSYAPEGWDPALAQRLAGAVLPGFSVFDREEIEAAGLQLLALGGPIRLKQAQARGGHGQQLVADAAALHAAVAALDPEAVRRHGVVLEQHLERATTCSVGGIRVAGLHLSYLGTQHQTTSRDGAEVYAGSCLRVVRGGLEALDALARDPVERTALRHAQRYEAAVEATHPGFFASRRNYDVVAGYDAAGRWRCGVLEQSWRPGGASPAEIAALAMFLAPDPPRTLEVSCHESHDPAHPPPAHAQVHYHDPSAPHGPVLKYAVVTSPA